jgi:hypothetical protein
MYHCFEFWYEPNLLYQYDQLHIMIVFPVDEVQDWRISVGPVQPTLSDVAVCSAHAVAPGEPHGAV